MHRRRWRRRWKQHIIGIILERVRVLLLRGAEPRKQRGGDSELLG
jgi:hypothetical protein